MTLGEKLKSLREKHELSQAALAKASGLARLSILRYETGQTNPKVADLQKVCDALGVKLGVFNDCN